MHDVVGLVMGLGVLLQEGRGNEKGVKVKVFVADP